MLGGPLLELLLFFATLESSKKDENNRAISGLVLNEDNVMIMNVVLLYLM